MKSMMHLLKREACLADKSGVLILYSSGKKELNMIQNSSKSKEMSCTSSLVIGLCIYHIIEQWLTTNIFERRLYVYSILYVRNALYDGKKKLHIFSNCKCNITNTPPEKHTPVRYHIKHWHNRTVDIHRILSWYFVGIWELFSLRMDQGKNRRKEVHRKKKMWCMRPLEIGNRMQQFGNLLAIFMMCVLACNHSSFKSSLVPAPIQWITAFLQFPFHYPFLSR